MAPLEVGARWLHLVLTHEDADAYLDRPAVSKEDYSDDHLHHLELATKVYSRFNENG